VQMEHLGKWSRAILTAAALFDFGERELQGALSDESRGKRKIAQDQAIAQLTRKFKQLRAARRDKNLRRPGRRKVKHGLCSRVEAKEFREIRKGAETCFAAGKELSQEDRHFSNRGYSPQFANHVRRCRAGAKTDRNAALARQMSKRRKARGEIDWSAAIRVGDGGADVSFRLGDQSGQADENVFVGEMVGKPYGIERKLGKRSLGKGDQFRGGVRWKQLDAEAHFSKPAFLKTS